MEEKRYSIVRVDMNNCNKCEHYYTNKEGNNDCRLRRGAYFLCARHGDTKEQMILKVAQALLIDKIERYRKAPNCDVNQTIIEHESRICLEKARKIVEFLGVK